MTTLSTSIEDALVALGAGLVIGVATDTVYGLAADALQPGADRLLAQAKERSVEVPVQVLVASFEQASSVGFWTEDASRVAAILWPGAVTLVVPRRTEVTLDLGGDGATVGVRWPAGSAVVEVCSRFGPLAATSANRHGEPPLRTAPEVARTFAESVAVVLDGGYCSGLASTVVDLTGDQPKLLREGAMPWADVEKALQL